MQVIKVKGEEKAKRLENRLLKKGYVVARVEREEEVKKLKGKRVDVVIIHSYSQSSSSSSNSQKISP